MTIYTYFSCLVLPPEAAAVVRKEIKKSLWQSVSLSSIVLCDDKRSIIVNVGVSVWLCPTSYQNFSITLLTITSLLNTDYMCALSNVYAACTLYRDKIIKPGKLFLFENWQAYKLGSQWLSYVAELCCWSVGVVKEDCFTDTNSSPSPYLTTGFFCNHEVKFHVAKLVLNWF